MLSSGIKITEIRIRNYRSLKKVDVTVEELTVLIGKNNSGKTSFLEAIFAAIGSGKRVVTHEDIYLDPKETTVPKDRTIIIDILILPINADGERSDTFEQGSYWVELWGNGVSQDENDNDFVAIRTQLKWNSTRGEYITTRKFLSEWSKNSENIENMKTKETLGQISVAQIDPFAIYLMDAKRDIQDDLHSRSSFWHKLVSDPDLPEEQVKKIERTLNELNTEIVSGSEVLAHVQEHLNELYQTVATDKGSVSITPLARHLRDLSKGMDITFATKGAQSFPLTRHGMGTRSLASVLTFRAYTNWRQKNAKGDIVHPVLALEEPEAHLHPQAQRALFNQIEKIPGQKLISTHSPYIAAQAEIPQFRHFRKVGAETTITQLDVDSLSKDEIRKINRMVMNTRGEILYARSLVFFEGETEEQALPIFAERFWNQHLGSLGISMIGVGGASAYFPFIMLAESFKIPWYIFSDGEDETIKELRKALKKLKKPDEIIKNGNIFVIPDGKCFEEYLLIDEYQAIIIEMIINVDSQGPQHFEALKKEWSKEADPKKKILCKLTGSKTKYAMPLAEAITGITDDKIKFPLLIKSLFEKMAEDQGFLKAEIINP